MKPKENRASEKAPKGAKKKKVFTGRPTKYRKAFCEQMINYLAKGYSIEAFAAEINVSRDTLYEWCEKHPEFSDSKKIAVNKAKQFYERHMFNHFANPKEHKLSMPRAAWIMFLFKCRYGYRDTQNVAITEVPKLTLNYKLDDDASDGST